MELDEKLESAKLNIIWKLNKAINDDNDVINRIKKRLSEFLTYI